MLATESANLERLSFLHLTAVWVSSKSRVHSCVMSTHMLLFMLVPLRSYQYCGNQSETLYDNDHSQLALLLCKSYL